MSAQARPTAELLLELADDELILGWRDSEWTGIAPFLEEDVAFSSIAQNEIGHARALYELAARDLGTDADALAFDRKPEEYRCAPLVQLRRARLGAHDRAALPLRDRGRDPAGGLKAHDDAEVAGLAAKIDREEVYHRLHAEMWLDRLLRPRERDARGAVEELWPYALGLLDARSYGRRWRSGWAGDEVEAVERGTPGADFAELWDEMTMVRRSAPVGAQW